MKARDVGAAAVALAGGYTAVLVGARRWHQHWGATDEEIARHLPGDDLIPAAKLHSTHAVTVHAPAERIWPWLAQMGYGDRAGTYSYDLFERRTGRNLYRVDPSIPPLAAGSTMPFYPGAPMTAAVAEPPHVLVLWQVTSEGKAIDPAGPWGDDYVAWSWAFVLVPVDAATTRLLVRMRVGYQPAAKWAPFMWLLVEPAHFVMGRRQLLGLRERAEANSRETSLSRASPAWSSRWSSRRPNWPRRNPTRQTTRPHLTSLDPTGADQSAAEHPPTDLVVGGSSSSRRAHSRSSESL